MWPEQLEQLRQRLEQPEGFESYFAIQAWLQEQFGVELCYSRLHQIVYGQLKALPKLPRPKAAQSEQAQAEFKKLLSWLSWIQRHRAQEPRLHYF
jgi:transposase